MTDWHAIADTLARPLRSSPCRCQKRWEDGKPEMVTAHQCSRCAALAAYEAATS